VSVTNGEVNKLFQEYSRQELADLQRLLAEIIAEQNALRYSLVERMEEIITVQQRANRLLEDAFVDAGLLPALTARDVPPTPPRDVDEELQKLRNARHDPDTYKRMRVVPKRPPVATMQAVTGDTEVPKALRTALDQAVARYNKAVAVFENRRLDREKERQLLTQTWQGTDGNKDTSSERFDLLWVDKIAKLARAVIAAEKDVETAAELLEEEAAAQGRRLDGG